jgi:hypothetical protein
VESSFDTGSIVVTEVTDMLDDVSYLFAGDFNFAEWHIFNRESRFRIPAEIENHFNKIANIFACSQSLGDFVREYIDECFQIVDDLCGWIYQFELLLVTEFSN